MAQFYAGIQGNKGEATRLGTKSSGLSGFAQGYDIGIRFNLSHTITGDQIEISITGGTNSPGRIARISLNESQVKRLVSIESRFEQGE